MPTINVTTHVEDSEGTSVEGARVSFRLKEVVIDTGLGHILPSTVSGVTDVSGDSVLAVWPNALGSTPSTYEVTILGLDPRDITKLTVSLPNSNCNLWDVANDPEVG